jgi:hypothetical protein
MAEPQDKVRVRLPDGRVGAIPRANLDAALSKGAQLADTAPAGPQQASVTGGDQPGMFDSALNATGRFIGAAADTMDPFPLIGALTSSNPVEKVGQMGSGILKAQADQLDKARESWSKGNHLDAARYALGYVIPMLGPAANNAGDDLAQGRYAEGFGKTAGLGLQIAAPAGMKNKGSVTVGPVFKPQLNPAEAAAVAWADAQGVPVDLATRSGSKLVQNVKTIAQNQFGSAGISKRAQANQMAALEGAGQQIADTVNPTPISPQQAGEAVQQVMRGQSASLAREGEVLANKVHPQPISPEQAGEGVQQAVRGKSTALAGQGDVLAGQVHPQPVTPEQAGGGVRTALEGQARTIQQQAEQARDRVYPQPITPQQAGESLGGALKAEILKHDTTADSHFDALRTFEADPANTRQVPVSTGRTPDVQANLDAFAMSLADKPFAKLQPHEQASVLRTAASAGVNVAEAPIMKEVALPVDLRASKAALKPIVDHFEATIPVAQRRASTGLLALNNILAADDFIASSAARESLSAIKAAARGADLPELATLSQGLAKKAVQHLEDAVTEGISAAGPEAVEAYKRGNQATAEKYKTAGVREKVVGQRGEPVDAYNRMTYGGDSGIALVRQTMEQVPNEIPRVGRAYLDELLEKKGAGDWLEKWKKLGPDTKDALFGGRNNVQALENAFARAAEHSDLQGQLSNEPVQLFRQLTYAKDSGIDLLRGVATQTPGEIPKVARAYLQGLFEKAKGGGEFNVGQSILSNWEQLGPGTKTALFKNPLLIQDISNFFKVAKTQGDLAAKLSKEPVKAFNQLTYAGDTGVDFLRDIARQTPHEIPKVGRAYLQELLQNANKGGEFNVGQSIANSWEQLGPQSKLELFKSPQLIADITNYFESAKMHSDLTSRLSKEPVQAFNQLTYAGDSGIDFLKDIAGRAGPEIPKVGRAYLEKLIEEGSKTGEFRGSEKLAKRWKELGPESKKILFKDPAIIKDLDNFFQAGEMFGRNPNPSGTAHVGSFTAQAGMVLTNPMTGVAMVLANPVLAKMLYSPRASRALTTSMKIPIGQKAAATVAFNNLMTIIDKLEKEQETEKDGGK